MHKTPTQATSPPPATVPTTSSDWSRFTRRVFGRHTAYNRLARHFDLLLRYGQPRKLLNIARAEIARLRGDIEVASFPFIYTVDIGNVCNLRCPLCPTGTNDLQRPQGFMRVAEFETILEKIKPYAIEVVMHNWGEPFLNPDFLEIVRAAKREGIGTAVSSNLNLVHRGQDYLHRVVDSGLDNLVVSIDGTTQEVYHHYRRGGDLAHVLDNLREMVRYKRSIGSATPAIEWQFIVMRHNEHQMDEVTRMASEIGVDRVRFTSAGMPFDDLANETLGEEWLPNNPDYRSYDPAVINRKGYLFDEKCFYLYRAMTVNPRGEVAPCCVVHHEKWDYGNLLDSSLAAVWNNRHYRASRALFSPQRAKSTDDFKTGCHACPMFKYEQINGQKPAP